MPHTTAIVLACVFAALALISTVFVKKRTLRIVLTAVCVAIALLCIVCVRQTAQDDEIKKESLERVSDDIEFAGDIIESTKFSGSQVTYTYEGGDDDAYKQLTDNQKKLYDEILPKVQRIEDFTYTAEEYGYDTLDDLLIVMGALNQDHPELELYFLISEVIDGDMTTALTSHYFMPGGGDVTTAEQKDELRHELEVFDAECNAIVAGMPEGLSTYDKYRYLAVVISLRTTYDYDSVGGTQIGTAYGAIEGGHSICQGYSRGFEYLCKRQTCGAERSAANPAMFRTHGISCGLKAAHTMSMSHGPTAMIFRPTVLIGSITSCSRRTRYSQTTISRTVPLPPALISTRRYEKMADKLSAIIEFNFRRYPAQPSLGAPREVRGRR